MSLQPSNSKGYPMAYFFHLRGKSLVQKSLRGMLMELLYQVLESYPRSFELIRPIFLNLNRLNQDWDIQTLSRALLCIPHLPPTVPGCRDSITLFVDALDENQNQDDNGNLLAIFDNLNATYRAVRHKPDAPVLKICLASRPWPIFRKRLGDNARVPSFAIHHFTVQDIQEYTTTQILKSLGDRQKTISQLSTNIASRAKGVFIWVRVVVDNLRQEIIDGTPIESLQKILHKYPEELDEMYKLTLKRVAAAYLPETLILFKTMLASRVSLTALELYTITNICTSNAPPNDGPTESFDDIISWLASRSGGLINMVDTGENKPCSVVPDSDSEGTDQELGPDFPAGPNLQVEFLHQTVQEFVRNSLDDSLEVAQTKSSVAQVSGSRLLALACLDRHPPHRHLRNVAKDIFSYIREVEHEEDDTHSQQLTSLPHWGSFSLHDFPFRIRDPTQSLGYDSTTSDTLSHYLDLHGPLTPMILGSRYLNRCNALVPMIPGQGSETDDSYDEIPEDMRPLLVTILHNLYRTKGPGHLLTLKSGPARDVFSFSLFFASVGPRLTNDRVDRLRMFQHIHSSFVKPWKAKHPAEQTVLDHGIRLPCKPITEPIDNILLPRYQKNLACMFACLKPNSVVDDSTLLSFAEGLNAGDLPPILLEGSRSQTVPMTPTAFCSRFRESNRTKWMDLFLTRDVDRHGFDRTERLPPFVDLATFDAVSRKPPPHVYTHWADEGNFTAPAIASACIPAAAVGLGNSHIFRALYPERKARM